MAKALAYDIINALFHRYFMNGRHWEISSATVEELDETSLLNGEDKKAAIGTDIEVFQATKEAVWDHKDIYSVANASAKIMVSSEGVYVDDYLIHHHYLIMKGS